MTRLGVPRFMLGIDLPLDIENHDFKDACDVPDKERREGR